MDKHKTIWTVVAAVAIAALVGWLVWFGVDRGVETTEDLTIDSSNQQEEVQTNQMLDQVLDNPEQYYGQQVMVEGEIQDLLSQRVFSISDDLIGDELLVVTKNPLTQDQISEAEEFFEDNANVSVAGTLREFLVADLESEFTLDFTDEIEAEFENQPVLVADSFSFSDGQVFDFTTE